MRNVIAFVVALAVVAGIFWWTRSTDDARPPAVASGSTPPPSPAPAAPAVPTKIDTVRRLDPAARKRLGEQIAAARARARAGARTQPTGDDPEDDEIFDDRMKLEDVAESLMDKLQAAIPILAECYPQGTLQAAARLTLMSDPELGTVIDTEAITNNDGQPLDAALDTCLRDAIDSLAMPPLGPKGGRLQLQYTLVF